MKALTDFRGSLLAASIILGAVCSLESAAETDLSGTWDIIYSEDGIELSGGPDIGDYTGLPINDAARLRAMAWNPSLHNMEQRQCVKLPLEFSLRWSNFRAWKEIDSLTQQLTAYRFRKEWGATERTIYMDGRRIRLRTRPIRFKASRPGNGITIA